MVVVGPPKKWRSVVGVEEVGKHVCVCRLVWYMRTENVFLIWMDSVMGNGKKDPVTRRWRERGVCAGGVFLREMVCVCGGTVVVVCQRHMGKIDA